MSVNKFLASCFLLLFSTIAYCQKSPVSLTVQLGFDTVEVGEHFAVTYTIENAEASDFNAPQFNDFELVSGPSTSYITSIVNGHKTQVYSYTYHLSAMYQGSFTIPPASLIHKNERLESAPIELVVVDKLSSPRINKQDHVFQNPFDNNSFFDDPFFDNPTNGPSMDEMMKEFDQLFNSSPFDFDQNNSLKDNFSFDDIFKDNGGGQSLEELMKEFENMLKIDPNSKTPNQSPKKNKKKEKVYKI